MLNDKIDFLLVLYILILYYIILYYRYADYGYTTRWGSILRRTQNSKRRFMSLYKTRRPLFWSRPWTRRTGFLLLQNAGRRSMHEIDTKIKLLDEVLVHYDAVYGDFMEDPTAKTKTYATIVGNPPFVRTKRGNLYRLHGKCPARPRRRTRVHVPSDFKLTSSAKLLNDMMTHGTFTHIFHRTTKRCSRTRLLTLWCLDTAK
jgi:hypothetical protein